ncbi:MAG: IS200/IS605 family transposase [Pirellulaceae bacterium]|jgi:REP element-mobilizing transposase RayT|nr:IS200/IS605 family transposase [Pirellulaceae bacterium]
MPQSLVKTLIHLVYSTKHRQPWLPDDVQDSLFAYQAGIFRQWESPAIVIGGVEDHIHTLFALSKNHALKKIVEEVKKGSSKWMKTEGTKNRDFYWQNGYAAFSVSESNVPDVRRYIENQREHHRKMTFQEELRALLARHGVEFDKRYVWD